MKKLLLSAFALCLLTASRSQGYNFFLGAGNSGYGTTAKVLGSGIADFSYNYSIYQIPLISSKDKIDLFFVPALRIAKYRFSDNLILSQVAGKMLIAPDPNPAHQYNTSFFSYDGSKMVTGWWHVPVMVLLHIGEKGARTGLFVSPFYDRYAFGYHKRRFHENGSVRKEKIRNSAFKNFPLNKDKFGFEAGFLTKEGLALSILYVYTPFFKTDRGPVLNEVRISLSAPLNDFYDKINNTMSARKARNKFN